MAEQRREELEQSYLATVAALAAALDAKDRHTEAHSRETAALAKAVGRRLGLEGETLRFLEYGALLHDIGKIGVPGYILHKPGPLDDEETAVMREHPVIGMLCTYINEAQTPESARRMYEAIKRNNGHSDYELEWFTVHAGADVEHSRKGRDLIVKHARDLPDFADRAWWTVERGITEWRALHDFYYEIISTS